MILQLDHVAKAFVEDEVLRDVSFLIEERERWVLFGRNGAGKSTLFKIITGEMEADAGRVIFAKDRTVAHLPQFGPADDDRPLRLWVEGAFDHLKKMEVRLHDIESRMASGDAGDAEMSEYGELLSRWQSEGGERVGYRVTVALSAMGFSEEQMNRPLSRLSGGQRQKVYLTRLSLTKADLLLLDEPTNHLDITGIRWLEDFVLSQNSATLIVSHDADFVRRVATRIVHLSHGKTETYHGGYEYYLEESLARNEILWKQIREQEDMLKKNKEYIAKFGAGTRSAQAQSRKKMLERVELLDAPLSEKHLRGLNFPIDEELPKDVLKVRHLRFGYGSTEILKGVDFEIIKNEKIAVVGRNGSGKSTLLKILAGHLAPTTGTASYGARIVPSFFDQELAGLDPKKTIFDYFMDKFPRAGQEEIRTRLGTFLFPGDAVFDPISVLSGGEKGRLQLLDLLMQKPNLLILDEPTNNLDISGISVLSSSLRAFEGALLLVSHDRSLIQQVATRVLVISQGVLHNLPGRFNENRGKIEELLAADAKAAGDHDPGAETGTEVKKKKVAEPEPVAEAAPESAAAGAVRKKNNEFKIRQLEEKIAGLEKERDRLTVSLASLRPDQFTEVPVIEKKMRKIEADLEENLARWTQLQ